jgi:uncharacterized membrane protein HdeD (DUF308 family)
MADPGGSAIRLTRIAGGWLGILTGAILLVWPGKTLRFVAALAGAWLVAIGVVWVTQALGGFGGRRGARNTRLLLGLAGLLYVIVGTVCLRDLFDTVARLSAVLGLVWTVGGVVQIAWRTRSSIPLGALGIAAGVALLVWPEITVPALALVVGIWLIVLGVLQVAQGFYRPKAAK